MRSALRPENIELVRKTSRCTSFAILSTDPGFDSPNAALRSEKDVYVSDRAAATALLYKNPKGASFSSAIVDDMIKGMGTNVAAEVDKGDQVEEEDNTEATV